MRPRFKLEINGNDATSMVADRLVKLQVKDEAGQKSDTIDISIDDRDNAVDIPGARSTLKCWLGYEESELVFVGEYVIDEVRIKLNPDTMNIRGKASDSSPELKATKTRSWHQLTIGEIVNTIAGEHGLTPRVHADYADRMVDHIDQENESDAHFLTRLGKIYGAVAKPADGNLLFIPAGQGISTSGKALPAATVKKEDLKGLTATVKERGVYSGVITRFRDKETNVETEVETNDSWDAWFGSGPVFRDKKLYTSRDMAEQAGKAQLSQLRSGNTSIDFTIGGRPDLFAERPVQLVGVRAPLADTFIVKSVTHTMSASGFETKVQASSKASDS